jgi:ABC-type Zn uptake system ZnuABC Zn-binding protein ZnuA/ABC-type Mn2+/Zn2+ transport system permease subunit
LWEVLLLAAGAGVLGTWIVARGLAFYTHGVAAATFPGLVVADGLGLSATVGAAVVAALFALVVGRVSTRGARGYDSATGLALAGAMALGVILASDVFHSGSNVQTLLFGSLLVIAGQDLWLAAGVSVAVLAGAWLLGSRWLATAFDPDGARSLGIRPAVPDQVLLGLVALAAVATLSALGALLSAALLVVPAATTRLWIRRMASWQAATVVLTAAEGTAGLWLSVKANVPPGPALAVLAGAVFGLSAVAYHARLLVRSRATAPALVLAALVALVVAGCGSSGGSTNSSASGSKATGKPLDVVASTTQLGDFVRQVGGTAVDLHQILQPNTDPHEYEPRPSDVTATAGAKLVFLSGNNLDKWMSKVISESGGDPTVVTIAPDHTPETVPGETSGPEASEYDPHWWHDPRNAEAAVQTIAGALEQANPGAKAQIAANANAYLAKLRALDAGIQKCFSEIPASQRKLVTSHDAFNYFAKRYDIDVVGAVIPSQTTQAQPSAGALAKLVKLVRDEHVKAIFPESSINPKLAQALAKETGAQADYTLYGDTLGPKGSSGATYLQMEQANANAMLEGFTGGSDHCTISGL